MNDADVFELNGYIILVLQTWNGTRNVAYNWIFLFTNVSGMRDEKRTKGEVLDLMDDFMNSYSRNYQSMKIAGELNHR